MASTEKLVEVDMRIRCAAENHESMCVMLRDALVDEFNNIRRINAVIPGKGTGKSDDFCVIGTATISPQNRARFQRRLSRFRSSRDPRVGVRRALVCVLERRL